MAESKDPAQADPHRKLKDAFSRFGTGVGLAGCRGVGGAPILLTINSFTSVSLDPPLLLWCLERRASSYPAFMAADAYSISVLRADQQALCLRFAKYNPDPLGPDECETWSTGAPILKDRLAAFDCEVVDRHAAGDHVILVARILRFEAGAGAPLLYVNRQFAAGPEAS